jgi:hypothetical protein
MIHHRVTSAIIGISMFVVCGQWPDQAAAQVNIDVGGVHVHVGDGQPPPPDEVVVLTRGPVHEAFAQPVILDEGAEFTITHRPPASLDEIVPDQKPDGNHIVWIPGYWSWDTDRGDFIWVSGCWRAVPPNNSWVPGYWAKVPEGYQWIAGFWTTADTDEIEYLPAPPATLEEGPQGAGSADRIWIPGCWIRQPGRYAWRPGFWEQARANWVWEPAHYVFTPRGYVYVDGYWDYSLERRGVAFLPVYCSSRVYGRAGFRYSPEIVLDLGVLTLELFSSPQRHHYYFGDYYGTEYSKEGFHPWYEARDHHDWYDPTFAHEQWTHRDDRKWADNQRVQYERRRDDKTVRPARTYEAMKTQVARLPENDRKQAQMARPMKEVVSTRTTPFKYGTLDAKTREATASRARDVHAYTDKRSQWESSSEKPKPPDHGTVVKEPPARQDVQPQKVKISRSPIVVREQARDKDLTPPPRPNQPKTDPNAKPRRTKDAPDRSKDTDRSDKDKPDSPRK